MAAPMSQALDPNLLRQLEEAYYGQTDATQPPAIDLAAMEQMPVAPQAAPRPMMQMPTQEDLNIKNQEANAPAMPLTRAERLMQVYEQQQRLQDEAIRSAEEQLTAARNRPQQMDLSPLIALAESWSQKPSGLLRAYRPPADQAKTIQALQEAVLKARGGAADLAERRETNLGKLEESKEAREQRLQEISLRKGELRQAKEDRAEDRKLRLELEQNDKYYKQFGEGISGLTEVISAAKDAKNLIDEAGGNIPTDLAKFDQYKRAVSRIITGYNRDVAKLGALAGADKKLLEAAASNDPNLLEAYLKNAAGLNKGQRGVLDDLIAAGDKKMKEHEQLVKIRFKGMADPFFAAQKSIYSQERGGQEPENLTSMTREQLLEKARLKQQSTGVK